MPKVVTIVTTYQAEIEYGLYTSNVAFGDQSKGQLVSAIKM